MLLDKDRVGREAGQQHHQQSNVVAVVEKSPARLGLISKDGHVKALSTRLARELGFDAPRDLSGLRLASLWGFPDRVAVVAAFETARRGRSGHAIVSMEHIDGSDRAARVTFTPAQDGLDVIMTFDWTNPG